MGGSDGSGEEVSLAIRALSTNLASPDRAARLPEPISYAQTDIAIIISKSIIFVLLTASTTLEGASMSLKTLIDASSGAIAADPANGRLSFTVDGELTGPTEVARRARGHEITVDEPPALGGSDRGANPVEHALIALASCQAIAYRFWAGRRPAAGDAVRPAADASRRSRHARARSVHGSPGHRNRPCRDRRAAAAGRRASIASGDGRQSCRLVTFAHVGTKTDQLDGARDTSDDARLDQ
jgi:hypothetical protein